MGAVSHRTQRRSQRLWLCRHDLLRQGNAAHERFDDALGPFERVRRGVSPRRIQDQWRQIRDSRWPPVVDSRPHRPTPCRRLVPIQELHEPSDYLLDIRTRLPTSTHDLLDIRRLAICSGPPHLPTGAHGFFPRICAEDGTSAAWTCLRRGQFQVAFL